MKKAPMIKPATVADKVEIDIMLITMLTVFAKILSYLTSQAAASKTTLAAVKPKKWTAPGLKIKLIIVAINPTKVIDPNFFVHQTTTVNMEKPIKSQRKGSPNIWKKIGEKIEFNTPHRPAESAIAARSMLLKYGISRPQPVIPERKNVILLLKYYLICPMLIPNRSHKATFPKRNMIKRSIYIDS